MAQKKLRKVVRSGPHKSLKFQECGRGGGVGGGGATLCVDEGVTRGVGGICIQVSAGWGERKRFA